MIVTEHFTLKEFASHDGVPYPGVWIPDRLIPLCNALEKIRALTNQSLHINSGYRSPAWNAHVKGAGHSQHVQGRAADIVLAGMTVKELHAAVLHLIEQKIIKDGGVGLYDNWIHYDHGSLRRWTGS